MDVLCIFIWVFCLLSCTATRSNFGVCRFYIDFYICLNFVGVVAKDGPMTLELDGVTEATTLTTYEANAINHNEKKRIQEGLPYRKAFEVKEQESYKAYYKVEGL